jgi:hypothetical protein
LTKAELSYFLVKRFSLGYVRGLGRASYRRGSVAVCL